MQRGFFTSETRQIYRYTVDRVRSIISSLDNAQSDPLPNLRDIFRSVVNGDMSSVDPEQPLIEQMNLLFQTGRIPVGCVIEIIQARLCSFDRRVKERQAELKELNSLSFEPIDYLEMMHGDCADQAQSIQDYRELQSRKERIPNEKRGIESNIAKFNGYISMLTRWELEHLDVRTELEQENTMSHDLARTSSSSESSSSASSSSSSYHSSSAELPLGYSDGDVVEEDTDAIQRSIQASAVELNFR